MFLRCFWGVLQWKRDRVRAITNISFSIIGNFGNGQKAYLVEIKRRSKRFFLGNRFQIKYCKRIREKFKSRKRAPLLGVIPVNFEQFTHLNDFKRYFWMFFALNEQRMWSGYQLIGVDCDCAVKFFISHLYRDVSWHSKEEQICRTYYTHSWNKLNRNLFGQCHSNHLKPSCCCWSGIKRETNKRFISCLTCGDIWE